MKLLLKKIPQFLKTYGKLRFFLLRNVSVKKLDEPCINSVWENEK
ncbi:hypothetical protein LEP1GSC188_2467 [Leptospira weilii serovar Topaz str. LT2116]|uniref:Uncharacterized protein n=1 Tax=Leptospira weilii serovar Topaz str. LT2116 TaxID=1088540 RepID=M3FIG0_9LEPT|nr:hypothetical protein LEP1GSC188_2467 [Leptospira weilii serovar Topaz str. LT2116]